MSGIDLSNPKVLKNFMTSRLKEGQGKVETRENVKVYVDPVYGTFVLDGIELPTEEKKAPVIENKEETTEEVVDLDAMTYNELKKEYTRVTGKSAVGKKKDEIKAELIAL